MTAWIFATDVSLPPGQRPDLAKLMPITAVSLDEALIHAARLLRGGVVWRIEEPSQIFDKPDSIVVACQTRGLLPYNWST